MWQIGIWNCLCLYRTGIISITYEWELIIVLRNPVASPKASSDLEKSFASWPHVGKPSVSNRCDFNHFKSESFLRHFWLSPVILDNWTVSASSLSSFSSFSSSYTKSMSLWSMVGALVIIIWSMSWNVTWNSEVLTIHEKCIVIPLVSPSLCCWIEIGGIVASVLLRHSYSSQWYSFFFMKCM